MAGCAAELHPEGVRYDVVQVTAAESRDIRTVEQRVQQAHRMGFRAGVLACLGVLPAGGLWDDLRRYLGALTGDLNHEPQAGPMGQPAWDVGVDIVRLEAGKTVQVVVGSPMQAEIARIRADNEAGRG